MGLINLTFKPSDEGIQYLENDEKTLYIRRDYSPWVVFVDKQYHWKNMTTISYDPKIITLDSERRAYKFTKNDKFYNYKLINNILLKYPNINFNDIKKNNLYKDILDKYMMLYNNEFLINDAIGYIFIKLFWLEINQELLKSISTIYQNYLTNVNDLEIEYAKKQFRDEYKNGYENVISFYLK